MTTSTPLTEQGGDNTQAERKKLIMANELLHNNRGKSEGEVT